MSLQKRVLLTIMLRLPGMAVRVAVQLDRESGGSAIEVQRVRRDGMLAAEFEIAEAMRPECSPEFAFGPGWLFTQGAGERNRPLTLTLSPSDGAR